MEEVELVCNAELFFSSEAILSVRRLLFRIIMNLSLLPFSMLKFPRFQRYQNICALLLMISKGLRSMLVIVLPFFNLSSSRTKTQSTELLRNTLKRVQKDF